VAVELFAAVTTYHTGLVELLLVVPLTWTALPTFTLDPEVEKVAINPVTVVPDGKVMLISLVDWLITPVAPLIENDEIPVVLLTGVLLPLSQPPQQPVRSKPIKRAIEPQKYFQ
jgi:hypothetical protein